MLIKNRLKITKNNFTTVSYNSLLLPAVEFIKDGLAYSDFVAIGTGGQETFSGDTHLSFWSVTKKAETDSFNFDPMNGQLFLTKRLVFDESDTDSYEIVELGLTADGNNPNPKIANRFVVNGGKPIFRDPKEEMEIEITIFLSESSESNLSITGGSNPLVKFLLGGGMESPKKFTVARGHDLTPNNVRVVRENNGLVEYDTEVVPKISEENMELEFFITSDLGLGVVDEILLLLNSVVVARQNVKEVSGLAEGDTLTITADADCMVTVNEYGINSISKVKNAETGAEITDFSTKRFATSFESGEENIFSGFGFSSSTKRVLERTGKKIGFWVDNILRVFDFSGSSIIEHDATSVDMTNVQLVSMFDRFIFLKVKTGVNLYDVYAYELLGNVYTKRDFNADNTVRDGVSKYKKWKAMDVAQAGAEDESMLVLLISAGIWLFGYYLYQDPVTGAFDSTRNTYTNYYTADRINSLIKTNRHQMGYVSHSQADDRLVMWIDKSHVPSSDPFAKDVASCQIANGYPKIAKNFAYAIDQDNMQIKAFNIDSNTGKIVSFEGNKITQSVNLDYLAVWGDEGVKVFYLDGSLEPYQFEEVLKSRPNATLEDVEFVGGSILKFWSDNVISREKLNFNKFIIEPIPEGTTVQVSYAEDNTPGVGGGKVVANFTVKVRV